MTNAWKDSAGQGEDINRAGVKSKGAYERVSLSLSQQSLDASERQVAVAQPQCLLQLGREIGPRDTKGEKTMSREDVLWSRDRRESEMETVCVCVWKAEERRESSTPVSLSPLLSSPLLSSPSVLVQKEEQAENQNPNHERKHSAQSLPVFAAEGEAPHDVGDGVAYEEIDHQILDRGEDLSERRTPGDKWLVEGECVSEVNLLSLSLSLSPISQNRALCCSCQAYLLRSSNLANSFARPKLRTKETQKRESMMVCQHDDRPNFGEKAKKMRDERVERTEWGPPASSTAASCPALDVCPWAAGPDAHPPER